MKKKRHFRKAAAVCMALLLTAAGLGGCSSKALRLGTAGVGGNYYRFGEAYAGLVNADGDVKIEVKETAGSAANLRLISDDYLQIAISQEDVIDIADEMNVDGFAAVAGLYTENCHVIVPADSDIRSVRDLRGKVVNLGEEESGSERNALQILLAYGLQESNIEVSRLNYTDAAEALREGKIDAMFVTVGDKAEVIETLSQSMGIRILSLDDGTIRLLTETYDFYSESEIPAGTYAGQNEAVRTVGVPSVLLVSLDLDDETVQYLTAVLFEHADELTGAVPVDFTLDPQSAVWGVSVPFHPGAAAYYKSIGIEGVPVASDQK